VSAKHTPGPWKIDRQDDEVVMVDASSGPAICDVYGDHNGERDANARLIAAAPDLYSALVELLDASNIAELPLREESERLDRAEDAARAAIKKARGAL
jgi:hypothetical protein